MQIKMIRAMLELYQIKNISKASGNLYITQQGLSRQIKALEEELGIRLFLRTRQGVEPTEICRRLYPCFLSMYESYCKVLDTIRQEQDMAQTLCIGFPYGISHGLGNHFLVTYQQAHPGIHLEIQEWPASVCQEKLLCGNLDATVLIPPFSSSDMYCQLIATDNMYAAMHKSHPLAASLAPLPFQELASEKIITGSSENALRLFFDYCCKLTGIQPQILISSSYNVDFVNSMTYHIGISTLTSAMAFQIHNPNVHIRQLILPAAGDIYLCRGKHTEKKDLLQHFFAFTKDYFLKFPIPNYSPRQSKPATGHPE